MSPRMSPWNWQTNTHISSARTQRINIISWTFCNRNLGLHNSPSSPSRKRRVCHLFLFRLRYSARSTFPRPDRTCRRDSPASPCTTVIIASDKRLAITATTLGIVTSGCDVRIPSLLLYNEGVTRAADTREQPRRGEKFGCQGVRRAGTHVVPHTSPRAVFLS